MCVSTIFIPLFVSSILLTLNMIPVFKAFKHIFSWVFNVIINNIVNGDPRVSNNSWNNYQLAGQTNNNSVVGNHIYFTRAA